MLVIDTEGERENEREDGREDKQCFAEEQNYFCNAKGYHITSM